MACLDFAGEGVLHFGLCRFLTRVTLVWMIFCVVLIRKQHRLGEAGVVCGRVRRRAGDFPARCIGCIRSGSTGLAPISMVIRADGETIVPQDGIYRPSHITLHAIGLESGVQVTEDKFITADDVVVSVLSLRNPGDGAISVRIDHTFGVPAGANEFRPQIPVHVHREAPPGDDLRFRLNPTSTKTLVFAVGFSPESFDRAQRCVWRWRNHLDPVAQQVSEYQHWFSDNVPQFDCSDPYFTKLWYHHWYLVRKNYLSPGVRLMMQDTFSGGRWESDALTAVRSDVAGNVVRDVRWLRDAKFVQNYVRGLAHTERGDGLFHSYFIDGVAVSSNVDRETQHDCYAAIREASAIHADDVFFQEIVAPAFERFTKASPEPSDKPMATFPLPLPLSHFRQNDSPAVRHELYKICHEYCLTQFEEGDYLRPSTTRNGERDCLHRSFADLVLTALLGIVPRHDDVFEMFPLLPFGAWSHFCVENLPYRGQLLTIVWDDPTEKEDAYGDGDKGLTIYLSGKRLHHQEDLSPVIVALILPVASDNEDD